MTDLERTLDWCRAELLRMITQLDRLGAGGLVVDHRKDLNWQEAEPCRAIDRVQKAIADLDKLIGQLEKRSEQSADGE